MIFYLGLKESVRESSEEGEGGGRPVLLLVRTSLQEGGRRWGMKRCRRRCRREGGEGVGEDTGEGVGEGEVVEIQLREDIRKDIVQKWP